MAYCTLDDIKKLLPDDTLIQVTDDEEAGEINTDRVNEAIAQADSEIDGYCGTKYSVPFASAPAVIKKHSVDIAIYNLYSRTQERIPDTRADRYKNAVRFLAMVAKGEISLGIDPEPAASSQASGSESNKPASDRIFTRNKMRGF